MPEDSITTTKNSEIEEMKKAGVHYGHKRSRTHPKARYFTIEPNNSTITFIDLEKTVELLQQAIKFIQDIVKNKGVILWVGTQGGAKKVIAELAQKYNFPYVNNRWLGGTLTNFHTLAKRIEYLKELEADSQSGKWEKFTKQERIRLTQELEKLQKKFAGLRDMKDLPQALFIIDPVVHSTAVREAIRLHIPIISILDTDDDPSVIDYPIPANDSAKSSISYIMKRIEEAIQEVQHTIPAAEDVTEKQEQKEEKEPEINNKKAPNTSALEEKS